MLQVHVELGERSVAVAERVAVLVARGHTGAVGSMRPRVQLKHVIALLAGN